MATLPEEQQRPMLGVRESWYVPIADFAIHVVVGTTIFLVITVAALVIHRLTEAIGNPSLLLYFGLRTAEVTLFVADVVLFLVFIARTSWRTLRKLMKGWNS